jgi:hypothetical protein
VFDAIPVLSSAECERVRQAIHALRTSWIVRGNANYPFYTVGAASYIDAVSPTPPPRYSEILVETNPVLREHFHWLYARLMCKLSVHLQATVRTSDELALPGYMAGADCPDVVGVDPLRPAIHEHTVARCWAVGSQPPAVVHAANRVAPGRRRAQHLGPQLRGASHPLPGHPQVHARRGDGEVADADVSPLHTGRARAAFRAHAASDRGGRSGIPRR